jgi:hypothetical protein
MESPFIGGMTKGDGYVLPDTMKEIPAGGGKEKSEQEHVFLRFGR